MTTETAHKELRTRLRALGKKRQAVMERDDQIRQELRVTMREADQAGIPVAEIAADVGLSLRSVYTVLNE